MTYPRHLAHILTQHQKTRKEALVLTGPRQVGKTTLLKSLFPDCFYLSLDDEPPRQLLNTYSIAAYRQRLPHQGIIILDEVQHLIDPGRAGKLIVDHFPDIHLILTGSAGLTIKNKHTESMAGRSFDYELLPLTFSEYLTQSQLPGEQLNFQLWQNLTRPTAKPTAPPFFDATSTWSRILIYGLYPALISEPDPITYLTNLVNKVIFRDLTDLTLIQDKSKALELLSLLAHQIGQLVSYQELAITCGLDQRTVAKYLKLFQESYLIYFLYPYSQRERDVLSKRPKVYFFDTGLRNALIEAFLPLNRRLDTGRLFENFVIMEAVKAKAYLQTQAKFYFWRTKSGAEIDLVIQTADQLLGLEIKWGPGQISPVFKRRYPQSLTQLLNPQNIY